MRRSRLALSAALGGCLPILALAQTTGTPRTQFDLLQTESQDGQSGGSITPSQMRNLITATYPATYRVTNYGAKCDGKIIYGGMVVSTDSPTVASPGYAFTSADVGATISLVIEPFNGYTTTAAVFASTIVSVLNGQATLASNPPFNSTGVTAARWYHTVDTTAIQKALDAASGSTMIGGGVVEFPAGVCVTGQLTFGANTRIVGQGMGASVVMLANDSNSDLFEGQDFASLTGTNNTGGVHDFSFENIQLDGNRGGNTGSGIGASTGTGNGVRVYGYEFYTDNVLIRDFAADGWYSEWSNTAGNPVDGNGNIAPVAMEPHIHNLKSAYNMGWGLYFNGAHDAQASYLWMVSNGTGGLKNNGLGSPLTLDHFHGYQNGGPDIDAAAPNLICYDCYAEGGVLLSAFNYRFTDSNIATLTLGQSGGSPVYGLQVLNTQVGRLNNVTGSGYNDHWTQGSIGSFGGNHYAAEAIETNGLSNQFGSLGVTNGPSYPVNLSTTAASQFTISNGVGTFYLDAGGHSSISNDLQVGSSSLALSAGNIGLPRTAQSNSAPGEAGLKLEVVCGTKAGTARLQAYAGTSTRPVTILNNIGSGVAGC